MTTTEPHNNLHKPPYMSVGDCMIESSTLIKQRPQGQGQEEQGYPSSPLPWELQRELQEWYQLRQAREQVSRRRGQLAQPGQRPGRVPSWQARERELELQWPGQRRAWQAQQQEL